jgi:hypothetical protein
MNVWTCLLLKRSLRGLHALTLEQWILTRTVHATQTRVSASAVHDHSLTSLLAVPHPWRPVSSGQCRTPPAPYPMSSDCSKPLYLDGTLLYPGTYFSDPYIFAPYAVFRSYQRECVVYWYSIQQPLHRSGYASQRPRGGGGMFAQGAKVDFAPNVTKPRNKRSAQCAMKPSRRLSQENAS